MQLSSENWYVTASGGWAYIQDESVGYTSSLFHDGGGETTGFQTWGWNVGLSVGKKMDIFRPEFQISYLNNNINNIHNESWEGSQNAIWYGVNGFYDIPINNNLFSYIGAGLGGLTATTDYNGFAGIDTPYIQPESHTSTVVSYQMIFGLGYQIMPSIRLSMEYRRLASMTRLTVLKTSGSTATTGKAYYNNNLFNLAVSYLF